MSLFDQLSIIYKDFEVNKKLTANDTERLLALMLQMAERLKVVEEKCGIHDPN